MLPGLDQLAAPPAGEIAVRDFGDAVEHRGVGRRSEQDGGMTLFPGFSTNG
jgi:hypothetical protein